jgi:tetratricopeptide (TPR) repeat protein
MNRNLILELSAKGYWPALALEYFINKKYSQAAELCMMRMKDDPDILSGRIILARTLYHSGQIEEAEKGFYKILQIDPENIIALKYLGDIKAGNGDEATAFSYYNRVLKYDPTGETLSINLEDKPLPRTRTLNLRRHSEKPETLRPQVRQIPFVTETVGDLLMTQGHPRLALEVFQGLLTENDNPRLREKAEKAEEILKNKEKKNV